MFERDPREETAFTQYTGLKIGAVLMPMLLLFIYFGKADMGLTLFIVLGVSIVAIKIRWNLRKHVWFWVIIAVIFALHVPLFFMIRWTHGNVPGIFYGLPFGLIDFVIISEGLALAEKLFAKSSSSSGDTTTASR
jgi:hypothetical protein